MSIPDSATNLASTFVVMNRAFDAEQVAVTESLYAELDEHYDGFRGHLLIAWHRFEHDWPTWEIHPHGDEVVCLVSGNVDMVLRCNGEDVVQRLSQPGEFVIVPGNTWHTARVHAPTMMIFVTPGEGTDNREAPP